MFDYHIYICNQIRYIRLEAGMAKLTRLVSGEGPQAQRQIIGLRQNGSINQYGYYPDIPLKRCLDLDTNPIVRIVEPPCSLTISDGRPISSN
jgi:hypothetical protein